MSEPMQLQVLAEFTQDLIASEDTPCQRCPDVIIHPGDKRYFVQDPRHPNISGKYVCRSCMLHYANKAGTTARIVPTATNFGGNQPNMSKIVSNNLHTAVDMDAIRSLVNQGQRVGVHTTLGKATAMLPPSSMLEIKETHLRRHLLPPSWPPTSAIEEIVTKSSGQFIFASVVVKYISYPRNNPARQLELVRDIRLREESSQNPFAYLDALYQHIFSQVEALDEVLPILAFLFLSRYDYVTDSETLFQLAPGSLEILLADLSAVIKCEPYSTNTYDTPSRIKFLHASLPDFLLDSSRSGIYHIDIDTYTIKLLCMLLNQPTPISDPLLTNQDRKLGPNPEIFRLLIIDHLILKMKLKTSNRLRGALMNFNFMAHSKAMAEIFSKGQSDSIILKYLYQQDFGDQGQAYRHVFDEFAAVCAKHGIDNFEDSIREKSHFWRLELLNERRSKVSESTCGHSCMCSLEVREADDSNRRATYMYHTSEGSYMYLGSGGQPIVEFNP